MQSHGAPEARGISGALRRRLNDTIKLLAPDFKPGSVLLVRPYVRRRYFVNREVPRMTLSILRKGPHSTGAVVVRLIADKRPDVQDSEGRAYLDASLHIGALAAYSGR